MNDKVSHMFVNLDKIKKFKDLFLLILAQHKKGKKSCIKQKQNFIKNILQKYMKK